MRLRVVAPVALLLLAATPVEAQEPFEQCGDLQLVFRNPDLQRNADGVIHAGGSIFAQFQAIGERADEITFFGFSFGVLPSPVEDDSGVCDLPAGTWPTGAYVQNYRADTNPDDGFFINLQTDLVPDGQYTAAVHAYDAQNNEIARGWTNAVVDNCDAAGPIPPARCDGDAEQHARQDKTQPWPIVLPGDGDIAAAPDRPAGATLTIEFAEPLSDHKFYINGNDETLNFTAWNGRMWDDDLLPGYGPMGLGGLILSECSQQPPQECGHLGEAYYYSARPITDDDVVRVEAWDVAGNLAKKEIHIGSGAAGAITDDLPNLQIAVDTLSHTINAGEIAIFQFSLTNTGGTTGHPFADAEGPPGWEITWTPAHAPVDPGQSTVQELAVRPPVDAQVGTHYVNATIRYDQANKEQSQEWQLRVNVGQAGQVAGSEGGAGVDSEGEGGKESPGASLVVSMLLVAAVALLRRK